MVGKTNAIGGSSSNSIYGFIRVTYPSGSTVTCTSTADSSIVYTAPDTSGTAVFKVPQTSNNAWRIYSVYGTQNKTETVTLTKLGDSKTVSISYILPAGYTQKNYIASTASGGQYINTGYYWGQIHDGGYTIEVDFNVTGSGDIVVLGSVNPAAGDYGAVALPIYTSDAKYFAAHCKRSTALTFQVGSRYVADISANGIVVSGTSFSFPLIDGTSQTVDDYFNTNDTVPMYLFGSNYNSTTLVYNGAMRIYGFKILLGSTEIVNYIPCLNASNVPGFYDTVNRVFKPSASGTFSYG